MTQTIKKLICNPATALFALATVLGSGMYYLESLAIVKAENQRREELVAYTKQSPHFNFNNEELVKYWWAHPQGRGIAEAELTPDQKSCRPDGCYFYFKEQEKDRPLRFYSPSDQVVLRLTRENIGNNLDSKITEFDKAVKNRKKMRVVLDSPYDLAYFGKLPESFSAGYGAE